MKPPPFLICASLAFWGWQTNLIIPAVILMMIIEGARLIPFRWDLSIHDVSRISDLCTVTFIGIFAYQMVTRFSVQTLFGTIQWIPLIFSPILLAELYSVSGLTDMRALSLILRNRITPPYAVHQLQISLTYPYIVVCVLSASAANIRTIGFYSCLFIISVWSLLSFRSRRYSIVLWSSLMIFAAISGYIGQIGLNRLQLLLEQKGLEWFADFERGDADPFQSMTAIGRTAELKTSGKIVFRVKPEFPIHTMLLRESSYNRYRFSTWISEDDFHMVLPEEDEKTWNLYPKGFRKDSVRVSAYFKRGKGLLKLPGGVFRIENMPAARMDVHPFGAVKVEGAPSLVLYNAIFDSDSFNDKPPDANDLFIPKEERTVCRNIVQYLAIDSDHPEQALFSLENYFNDHFRYSLSLTSSSTNVSPISTFLLKTREGHCEYFATAAALLLRTAGIPTRYATGYAVHEYSDFEGQYVVRSRDAHAWTLAYLNGKWRDVDLTPSSWIQIETRQGFSWETLSDIWSWAVFIFSKLRWTSSNRPVLAAILLLLISYIVYRVRTIRANKRIRINKTESAPVHGAVTIKEESSFFQIEARLAQMGLPRFPWESLYSWIKRIENKLPSSVDMSTLRLLLKLHYRYRFDPNGIGTEEEKTMRRKSEEIVRGLSNSGFIPIHIEGADSHAK